MSIKSSFKYMDNANAIVLYQMVCGTARGDLKKTVLCKRYREYGKSALIIAEPDAIRAMFRQFEHLFIIDDFIEWVGKKSIADVMPAVNAIKAQGYKITVCWFDIDYKDIPSNGSRGKSEYIENMAAEALTALTGEKWKRTGDKRRGANGSYHPDAESESGLKAEVKGCGSVFSVRAARDVHQHSSGNRE